MIAGPNHPYLYSFTHHIPSGPLDPPSPQQNKQISFQHTRPLGFCAPSAHHIPLCLCSVSYQPPKFGRIEIVQASNPRSHFCHRIGAETAAASISAQILSQDV